MNRLQFIGQTHKGKTISAEDVVRFFDHTMAAYEVVGAIDGIDVSGDTDKLHMSMRFKAVSPDLSNLDSIVAYVNDTLHNRKELYGKMFNIDAKIQDSFVEIDVQQI